MATYRKGVHGHEVRTIHALSTLAILISWVHSGVDGGGRVRPSSEELDQWGAEFSERWNSEFAPHDDKAPLWVGLGSMYESAMRTRQSETGH